MKLCVVEATDNGVSLAVDAYRTRLDVSRLRDTEDQVRRPDRPGDHPGSANRPITRVCFTNHL